MLEDHENQMLRQSLQAAVDWARKYRWTAEWVEPASQTLNTVKAKPGTKGCPEAEGHTPGPWMYRPYKHDDWGMVRGADGYPIASVSTCRITDEEKDMHRRNGTDPVKANAELIAAAPFLLAGLTAMLDENKRLRKALDFYADRSVDGHAVGDVARAARRGFD